MEDDTYPAKEIKTSLPISLALSSFGHCFLQKQQKQNKDNIFYCLKRTKRICLWTNLSKRMAKGERIKKVAKVEKMTMVKGPRPSDIK